MCEDRMSPVKGNTSNVIAMNRHRPDPRFAYIPQVEAYWHALRGRRIVPRRAEVDPRGIESALEYAFILEQVAPGIGRLRIAGGHLVDLLGMEVRGMPLTAFFQPEARRALAECLVQVCNAPATARLSLQAETGIGKPPLEARLLLLPMRSETGEISRVLGCLDSSGSIGRTPRRFTITARQITEVTGEEDTVFGTPQAVAPKTAVSQHGHDGNVTLLHAARRLRGSDQGGPRLRLVETDA
jgi:hypothetical protein